MDTHCVVDPLALFDHARKDVVYVADREPVVGAEVLHHALGPGPAAIPGLADRVLLSTEEYILAVLAAGYQNGDGLRLREPREVVEIAVLSIGIVDVPVAQPDGRRRQNRDCALAHDPHQLFASLGKFSGAHALFQLPLS